jgi:hypothetical protein
VPVNDLSLLIHNPVLVYSLFALYGVMMLLIVAYVHSKFRKASKTLQLLQTEWTMAETKHASIVDAAQERLSKFSAPAPAPAPAASGRKGGIGSDIRTQIVGMAKRGIRPNDIARACGMEESEVDVVLGMARLQR